MHQRWQPAHDGANSPYRVGRWPGVHTRHLSTCLGSNCVTHIPTLSPCIAVVTGSWNICIDLTFLLTFKVGISIVCKNKNSIFTRIILNRLVRHWRRWIHWVQFRSSLYLDLLWGSSDQPRIWTDLHEFSSAQIHCPPVPVWGCVRWVWGCVGVRCEGVCGVRGVCKGVWGYTVMSWSTPCAVSAGEASGPPGLAATATTGHPAKRVLSKVLRIFLVICNSN